MAVDDTNDNDDNQDDVAIKAKEIGKTIGVEKDDTPDYDVIEGDDERIAKERSKASGDVAAAGRKKLTSKEKRDLRRKRVEREITSRDATIAQQQAEIDGFRNKFNEIEGRLTNVDKTKLEEARTQTAGVLAQAEKDYAQAFSEGDGVKSAQALGTMYDAKRRIEQIDGVKQQYERAATTSKNAAPANNGPNPKIVAKAKAWAAKHEWYDPSGNDEDSEIAKAISGKLANEGFNAETDDFWDELEDRLEARSIGKVADAKKSKKDEEDDDDEDDEIEVQKPRRRNPPVGGGGDRNDGGGKVQVKLPTEYVKNLKELGMWDDVTTRNRMIKRYLDGVKANQAG